jgi:hypothetical protein
MMICPNPEAWSKIYKQLQAFALSQPCVLPAPPVPLVLAGWAYSNDLEKRDRWSQTVSWATLNGCPELTMVPGVDLYSTGAPTSYQIGPLGGPMNRE